MSKDYYAAPSGGREMMMFRLWAWITWQKVVYLMDFDGEITETVARPTPFGYVAKRHWPFNVHNVLLNPDGTVTGSYVNRWRDWKHPKNTR